ncbi:MAG: DUF1801 domain-containing protein [Pyrinomonadaceae bacterium]
MEKVKTKPDDYIKSLSDDVRVDIEKLDKEISKIMNGTSRVLWSGVFWGGSEQNIIGYGDFPYVRKGKKVEWFFIGLAVQKNYISLYVNAVEDNKYLSQKYADQLGKVKVGASSISFKRLADVDMPNLLEMLKRASSQLKAAA